MTTSTGTSRWVTPPALMRGLAVAAVVGQGGIAVTGATVRVTGSGLGCPTWPECFPGSMFPVAHAEISALHQWVEFGNRLLGVALVLVTAACVIAAWRVRPRRRRLLLLAATMPLGVIAQAVIGGITVLTGLAWYTVAPHFLVTIPLIWLAVLLHRDAAALEDGPTVDGVAAERRRVVVPTAVRRLLVVTTVVLGALLAVGTLVTAAGPHGGDAATPRLEAFSVPDLAMTHAHLVFAYLGLLVGLGFLLSGVGAPRPIRFRYGVLVAITVAQGALGRAQYALGVPELLVALHVLGSVLVTAAAAWVWAATTEPVPTPVRDRSDGTVGERDAAPALSRG